VQLLFAPAPEAAGRFGCVIGAKQVPRAVDRNRLKRMLREAVRARHASLQDFDVVVRLRSGCVAAELPGIVAEATVLMDRLEGEGGAAS
jgi:ribonuclease P protein component